MPGRILVVEDVRVQARYLCRLLELDGHQVVVAPDMDSSLRELSERSFDLVLADMVLSGEDSDGIALFRS